MNEELLKRARYERRLSMKRKWYAENKDKVKGYNQGYYTDNIKPVDLSVLQAYELAKLKLSGGVESGSSRHKSRHSRHKSRHSRHKSKHRHSKHRSRHSQYKSKHRHSRH